MRIKIKFCIRCRRWEVWFPTPGWEGGDWLVAEGFETLTEAMESVLHP